jgi:hypothetical protein
MTEEKTTKFVASANGRARSGQTWPEARKARCRDGALATALDDGIELPSKQLIAAAENHEIGEERLSAAAALCPKTGPRIRAGRALDKHCRLPRGR